ncbi:MAG: tRNA lysidine(34) synthetase TilS [Tepidisphaera sp.]
MALPLSKRDPTVAKVLRRWRALTGGTRTVDADRRTLVACSGGPDSVALALAVHATGGLFGLAHIIHDLRPATETHADRDYVASLAARLGVPFLQASVEVRSLPGSAEASARTHRYRALASLAEQARTRFIATGHHADDQLETLIMRLARGSGPTGLRGILPVRKLESSPVRVIRPCLGVRRAELASLCALAELSPRVDATNADTRITRNAIRAEIVPRLAELFPGLVPRADEFAARMRSVERVVDRAARNLVTHAKLEPGVLSRDVLRVADRAIVHAALRRVVLEGGLGSDGMTWRAGEILARAVRDEMGGIRRFAWGKAEVLVESDRVTISRPDRRPT